MVRTAINLYTVRELDEPTLDVLDRVADAGYDGVQFSGGVGDAAPAEVAEKLDERGLDVTAPHVGIDDLEGDFGAVAELYGEHLGCDSAVVPYLGVEHFESEEAVDQTAERLNDIAADLGERDWGLQYHNHEHEFVDLDGGNAFDRFAAGTEGSVDLEVDVGWVRYAGHDPAALLERYGDRVDLVHMKDVAVDADRDECFREIGEGDVDMAACADAAREIGASWLIYEHDAPEDPAASIDAGAAFLDGL